MSSGRRALARIVPRRAREARALLKRRVHALRELVPAYTDDVLRYVRHSSSTGPYASRENLRGKITATYHNLEKGLSLPAPRAGFGERQVGNLVTLLRVYVRHHGYDAWSATPIGVLESYRDHAVGAEAEVPHAAAVERLLAEARAQMPELVAEAGVREVSRRYVDEAVAGVGLDFFTARSSVRQYAQVPVDLDDIRFAARAAQRAPAVCNRQYNRIHVFLDEQDVAEILEVQGGARGFGRELGGLAIITGDLRNFWGAGERHQAWTDGGLFGMSFVLGLHARGLGTVCLNWSKRPEADRRLRELVGLPPESVIVMLVGFGHLRDTYRVAHSNRLPLDETLEVRGIVRPQPGDVG